GGGPAVAPRFPYTTLFRSVHAIDLAVTMNAAHPAVHVDRVVEIHVVGHSMNLHPRDWFPRRVTLSNQCQTGIVRQHRVVAVRARSEEHTSELQSRENLVCR